ERRAVAVEVLDRNRLAVDHPLPGRAVADEHDLLAGLGVDPALVGAEHDVEPRHLLVGLLVEHPEDLDRLLDRAGAAAPAVVAGLRSRRWAGVRGDVRTLEVLLYASRADLEAAG